MRFLDSARNDKAIIERADTGTDLLQADEYLARVGRESDASAAEGVGSRGEDARWPHRLAAASPSGGGVGSLCSGADEYLARVGVKAMPTPWAE